MLVEGAVQMPVCGSLDRERLLFLFLFLKTDLLNESRKVLHVAPEVKLSHTLQKHIGLDFMTADLHSKKVMLKMDITNIQLPDDSLDVIPKTTINTLSFARTRSKL